ncbi:hypothetical protein ACO22_07049 [Paracoccidioides brasiliensis]|uniref:Uncharacterized protein n=1 Tax=Paracoccidioides brasiliensis TaxID=121759 RepID=A0A1D2J5T5_PARBR|nr:hypothetical protein ACO22_07049 [Paracoccidioides brasiliensis]
MSSAPAGDADRSTDGIHAGFPRMRMRGVHICLPTPARGRGAVIRTRPPGSALEGRLSDGVAPVPSSPPSPPQHQRPFDLSSVDGKERCGPGGGGAQFRSDTYKSVPPTQIFGTASAAGRHGVSSRDVSVPHACNVSRVAAVGSAGIGGHPGSFLRSHGWSRGDGHPGPSRPPTAPPRRDPRPFSMPGRAPPVWSRAPSAPPVAPSTAGQLERSRRICPHPPPPAGRGIPGGKAGPESAARQRVRGGDPPSEGPMRQPVFALAGRHTILPRTVL